MQCVKANSVKGDDRPAGASAAHASGYAAKGCDAPMGLSPVAADRGGDYRQNLQDSMFVALDLSWLGGASSTLRTVTTPLSTTIE